jgi:hypothetical protein
VEQPLSEMILMGALAQSWLERCSRGRQALCSSSSCCGGIGSCAAKDGSATTERRPMAARKVTRQVDDPLLRRRGLWRDVAFLPAIRAENND